jgi:hypothetical protein
MKIYKNKVLNKSSTVSISFPVTLIQEILIDKEKLRVVFYVVKDVSPIFKVVGTRKPEKLLFPRKIFFPLISGNYRGFFILELSQEFDSINHLTESK